MTSVKKIIGYILIIIGILLIISSLLMIGNIIKQQVFEQTQSFLYILLIITISIVIICIGIEILD